MQVDGEPWRQAIPSGDSGSFTVPNLFPSPAAAVPDEDVLKLVP